MDVERFHFTGHEGDRQPDEEGIVSDYFLAVTPGISIPYPRFAAARERWRQPSLFAVLIAAAAAFFALAGCAPSAAGPVALAAAGQSAFEIREYPLVEQSTDNPNHIEFQERVPAAVTAKRQGWSFHSPAETVQEYNRVLSSYGFHLEANQSPPFGNYSLYDHGRLFGQEITHLWPVTLKEASGSQPGDFLLPFVTNTGERLVASADGIHPWPGEMQSSAPVYFGDQVAYAQVNGDRMSVYAGPGLLYAAQETTPQASSDLFAWEQPQGSNHWAMLLGDRLIMDGVDQNPLRGYESVFGLRVIDNQPMYFYVKNGLTQVSYAGRSLPYTYDLVVHGNSGTLQEFNPGSNGRVTWFYALRDGLWYYVEMGKFE